MGDITKSTIGNSIWCDDSRCNNICFTESEGFILKQDCNKNNVNQYWMTENTLTTKTKTAYIYNETYRQCLYDKGEQSLRPVLADCSNTPQSKWIVSSNGIGFYRSAYNSTLCLYTRNIEKGTVIIDTCNYKAIMKFNKDGDKTIKSSFSDSKCLGLLTNTGKQNENRLSLNNCIANAGDQYWKIEQFLPSEGRCGKEFGNKKCSNNECCSNDGWCGTSNDYCSKKNCQPNFGKCNNK